MLKKISKGKYNVPHFTQKGEVGEYALQQLPTTLVSPGFYYQNFSQLLSRKEEDGTLVYTLPSVRMLTGFDINELGEAVVAIANRREEWIGKTIPLYGDNMPLQKYIDQIGEITKQKVRLETVSREQYAKLNIENAREFSDMFGWIDEYGYYGPEVNLELGRKVFPNPKTFSQFLQSSKIIPK